MSATQDRQLSRGALIALVVGSMVGAGIFTLPAAFARSTGALGAMLAWAIAGSGMLMLALVFQNLSRRKPELDAGIYAYAKAGFGPYLGFSSAFGYWIACCLADVACLVLIKATLGQFWPVFGDGSTPTAIAGASLIVWGVHLLLLRGVKQAAALNTIATIAKLVPIAIFVFVVVRGFRADVFALNFWGTPDGHSAGLSDIAAQVRRTMLVTVFVFVGIEGASVYSRYAKDRNDVGIATVLGFFGVLCLLVLVTVFSYGILLRPDLAALATPSMAGVMEAIVGPWGRVFVSVGLLISIAGNYLSWSMLAAEVVHSAAKNQSMPKLLAQENPNGVPHKALWLSNIVIQLFLLLTWFAEQAFTIALKMTSAMTLIPYLLVGAYAVKLAHSGNSYGASEDGKRRRDGLIAALATVYAAAMLVAGGTKFVLLAALLYAPGSCLYFYTRREQGLAVFSAAERFVFGGICLAALIALYALLTGALTI